MFDGFHSRMHDLEMNIGRMRQDHELLQKKLKEEQDRKMKLEVSLCTNEPLEGFPTVQPLLTHSHLEQACALDNIKM